VSSRSAATAGDLLGSTARSLGADGIALPALEARLLVGHVLGLARETLLGHPQRSVTVAEVRAVDSLAARRRRGEPLAYILGEREFWSLPFTVTADVLIPRPDSEAVVETALHHLAGVGRPLRILDLGTGSGCLLLALLRECSEATGIGIDRSEAALRLARSNARRLGFDRRCAFVCADWGAALAGSFDLIVSNPPYINDESFLHLDPAVRCYEPACALRGGADGLDAYRALGGHLARLLASGGLAVVEIGEGQRERVAGLLAGAGLKAVGVGQDLAGRERCLTFRRR
jgi:release factor glutamine methyltransferase